MTIYKPNNPDRKQGKKLVDGPEVVIDDKLPLTDKAKGADVVLLVHRRRVTNTEVLQRRRRIRCVLVLMVVMLVVVIALGAIVVHKFIWPKPYRFECQVTYNDDLLGVDPNAAPQYGVTPTQGTFDETIEVDDAHERLQVPPVMDFRRSTIMHDFEKNLTAIVDLDHGRCYILPLDSENVKPPKSLMDLLNKFESGYYMRIAKIVRESYRVVTPPIEDIEALGYYIWNDCQFYETYRLVKNVDGPIAKRSACRMAGNKFCLGGTYIDHMNCITLVGCI